MKPLKLFIPGPVDVLPEVLQKMATPPIGHRTKEMQELYSELVEGTRKLLHTDDTILFFASSSSGIMEAAARNCMAGRSLIISTGAFGHRWHRIALGCGKDSDLIIIEWGKACDPEFLDETLSEGEYDSVAITHNETSTGVTNPLNELSSIVKDHGCSLFVDAVSSVGGIDVNVEKFGIDVLLFGTQKCLGIPPGMAICSVSDDALKIAKSVRRRGYYFDFIEMKKYADRHMTPATPSLPHMFALQFQLKRFFEEGLENRFKRHLEMGEYTRSWAKEHFSLFADERFASNTVTCVRNIRNVDIPYLKNQLAEKGYLFAPGYGKRIQTKTFRIGHMADRTLDELKEYIDTIDEILGL